MLITFSSQDEKDAAIAAQKATPQTPEEHLAELEAGEVEEAEAEE